MLFKYLALASTASATCLHGLTKFKRAEGEEVKVGTFGYTATNGPLNWASLDPANEACKTGKQQSPINIDDSIALATEAPILDIPEQKVEFENLGTTVEVIVNGTTKFAGTDFRLKQFHVHTPSEHRIGEEYFPLEVHMVHEGVSNPNSLAVISVLFQMSTGTPSPLIKGLLPHVAAIATPGTKTEIESLDFAELINHVQTTPLFQYTGSLTTPPCAEGLTFLVTKEPLNLDVETYNALKGVVKFNSRYTQNALGEENMIAVAEKSGTEQQVMPKQKVEGGEKNATASASPTATVAAGAEAQGPFTKGQTLVITEIQGTPTSMVGVVVKRDWKA